MKREEEKVPSMYEVYGEKPILVSEKDAEVFFNEIENPTPPNEALLEAKENYDEVLKKKVEITSTNLEEVELSDELLKKKS
jgi:hypothetical protein